MKKTVCTFAIGMLLCSLLSSVCSGCALGSDDAEKSYFAEENQVKNYKDGDASAFGLNIAPADEMGDWAVEWLADVMDGEGFQYYIYADSDSWDGYLYYPQKQAEIRQLGNEDVAVEFSDGVLKVYVTPQEGGSSDMEDGEKWLLHFAAPPVGAWPSEIELYWDGDEVIRDAVSISQ